MTRPLQHHIFHPKAFQAPANRINLIFLQSQNFWHHSHCLLTLWQHRVWRLSSAFSCTNFLTINNMIIGTHRLLSLHFGREHLQTFDRKIIVTEEHDAPRRTAWTTFLLPYNSWMWKRRFFQRNVQTFLKRKTNEL